MAESGGWIRLFLLVVFMLFVGAIARIPKDIPEIEYESLSLSLICGFSVSFILILIFVGDFASFSVICSVFMGSELSLLFFI